MIDDHSKQAESAGRRVAAASEERAGLSPAEWPKLKALLSELQDLKLSEREERIRQAYPNDSALRRYALDLLNQATCSTERLSSTKSWSGPGKGDRSTPLTFAPGDMCGDYRVKKQIGAGGMGLVFLAEDTMLGRVVALKTLKVLSDHEVDTSRARTQILEEARRQAALRTHAHIATLLHVTHVGDSNHTPVLVMEYVEGTPASAQVANGPVRPERVLRWAGQVADAIDHAHIHGILHCDLKPANIQINTNDDAKVLDFGLARAIHSSSEEGLIGGTLPYMAPEQLQDGVFSEASDMYSFGVTLFELFTGRRPFDAPTRGDLVLEILGSPRPKASALVPTLRPELDAVLEKALAKEPAQRFRTGRELIEALRRALKLRDKIHWPTPLQWVAIMLGAIVLATGLGFVTSRALDIGLGRIGAFRTESPLDWPGWGFMSLTAPVLMLAVVYVGLHIAWSLVKAALKIPAVGRVCAPVVEAFGRGYKRVRSLPNSALTQLLLALQVASLALICWYYYPLVQSLITFANPSDPGSLAELRPSNGIEAHNPFRYLLSAELFVFASAWYRLLRRSSKQNLGVVPSGGAIAGGAVVLVTLFAFALPFRPIYHAEFQRVMYGSARCYWIAEQSAEVLLYCPLKFPRQLTVKVNDPLLVKTEKTENIFQVYDDPK